MPYGFIAIKQRKSNADVLTTHRCEPLQFIRCIYARHRITSILLLNYFLFLKSSVIWFDVNWIEDKNKNQIHNKYLILKNIVFFYVINEVEYTSNFMVASLMSDVLIMTKSTMNAQVPWIQISRYCSGSAAEFSTVHIICLIVLINGSWIFGL